MAVKKEVLISYRLTDTSDSAVVIATQMQKLSIKLQFDVTQL